MNRYRRAWLSACRILIAIGVCLAILAYPSSTTIALWCAAAVVGAVVSYAIHCQDESRVLTRRNLLRSEGINALATGCGLLALIGLAVVLQSLLWVLMVLALRTSPWTLKLLRRHASSPLSGAPGVPETACMPEDPVEAAVFAPSIRALDNLELCQAWVRSYQWLEGTHSLALHAYIITLRQAYLDEMDRRDPAGLQAWLDSAPRPRGGPDRFLHHNTGDHHLSD